MKKTIFAVLALALSSFAAPAWHNVTVSQVWVAHGSTPFAIVDVAGLSQTTFCVYLSTGGAEETLALAQEALLKDLTIKVYVDPNESYSSFYTNSGGPISVITGRHLYALAVPH